jgi:hypothetical protein
MYSIDYEIEQAEKRVQNALDAIASHPREWRGAERNTTFAIEDMQRKQNELRDARATLYNLRAQKPLKTSGWKLAYVAAIG